MNAVLLMGEVVSTELKWKCDENPIKLANVDKGNLHFKKPVEFA